MVLSLLTENARHMYCIICFTELSDVLPPETGGMCQLKQVHNTSKTVNNWQEV